MKFDFNSGGTGAVEMDLTQLQELSKALEIGYGTDVAALTGGGALRVQSLDTTMQAVIQENRHFTLFNKLPKPKIGSTVDEWTEMSDVGGFLGGSTNTETGTINASQGQYDRRVGLVKYLMDRRSVSFVATITDTIVSAQATEQRAGALKLLGDANYLSYMGDSAVVPTQFDGISAQLRNAVASGLVDPDHVIDMRGGPLNSIEPFTRAGAAVSSYGSFGMPTDVFWPNSIQADMDANLDPAFRVGIEGNFDSIKLGTPVSAIRLSQGVVKANQDVFIPDDRMTKPFEANPKQAAIATANAGMQPTLAVGSASSNAASRFEASHAGQYYYLVCGVSAKGESTGVISSQYAYAAGEQRTLTITASGGNMETGYAIYRSRKNGTNAPADFRLMARIAKTAGGTTTFIDRNIYIPGTTEAFMLNMTPGDTAITWRQLLPMFKFQLYPTDAPILPWAQMLFGYLRISKLKHHAKFTNVLPNNAQWKPFG